MAGLAQKDSQHSQSIAYVYQSDLLISTLTVEETIRYSTWLNLDKDVDKELRVRSIMAQLGLTKVKNSRVFDDIKQCGLSGGERKRLSIAIQIVAEPKLILLDEPTSGLDSALALETMTAIRGFCTGERVVITTIHQPSRSVYNLFDTVLVLVQGRVAYCGPAQAAVAHFTHPSAGFSFPGGFYNPAEFLLDIARAQLKPAGSSVRLQPAELSALFEASALHKATLATVRGLRERADKTVLSESTGTQSLSSWALSAVLSLSGTQQSSPSYARDTWAQTCILMHRTWTDQIRDTAELSSQLARIVVTGLLIGVVFYKSGDAQSPFYQDGFFLGNVVSVMSIFSQLCVYIQFSNMSTVYFLTSSTMLYRRESGCHSYSSLAYMISRAFTLVPLQFGFIFVLIFSLYWLCKLPYDGAYFCFMTLAMFIANFFSFAFSMALTANLANPAYAYIIIPAFADVALPLSGYNPFLGNMPTFYEGLSNLSVARWLYEALMVNHWTRYDTDDYSGDAEDGSGDVLADADMDNFSKFYCLWILVLMIVAALATFYWGILPAPSRAVKVTDAEDARAVLGSLAVAQSTTPSILDAFLGSSPATLSEKLIVPDASQLVAEDPVVDYAPALKVQSFTESTDPGLRAQGCCLVFRNVNSPAIASNDADDGASAGPEDSSVSSLSDDAADPETGVVSPLPGVRGKAGAAPSASSRPDKMYVQSVSGVIQPGEMCAIMGSSGAGKTSLLSILSQRKNVADFSGSVYYNGALGVMPPFGFVTQEDVHEELMTVRESLEFACELRLPESMSREEKSKRVQRILNMLLLQKVADNTVGGQDAHGISGGELKRLSIGVELLHFPGLMFLDEPTTGLDSSTSLEVLSALRSLANQNRTVVMTIHQPSQDMFQLFDKALIMAESRVVYFGGVHNCTEFYTDSPYRFHFPATVDPAEFMISAAGGFIPAEDGRTVTTGELAAYYGGSERYLALREMIKSLEQSYASENLLLAQGDGDSSNDRDSIRAVNHLHGAEPSSLRHQLATLLGRRALVMRRKWRYYMWLFAW
jgi:ABC-type multidrug transport system ATPase subunit